MSNDKDNAGKPRLVVLLGDAELTPELRDALAAFPGVVRTADSMHAVWDGIAEHGELILTALNASLLADLALEPRRAADGPRPGTEVRARSPRPFEPNRLYEDARAYVEDTLSAVRTSEEPDFDQGRLFAERMHTDLLRDNSLVNRCLEPHESYDLASHCVNVAVLGGKIALGMVSDIEDAVEVIHAGLLHDIGMAKLPKEMLRKQGTWSEKEREALQQHPIYGAEILERCAPRCEWLKRAVLQEHERARGQGYPYGLRDEELDPIARIIGVADVFEALSHPRTYRSPYTALQALERVVGMQEEYFSPQVVSALVNEISAFPLDSYVQISSGEIGRVVATDPANILRPRIELVWDADWNRIEEPSTLDLGERPDLTVARALLDSELPIT